MDVKAEALQAQAQGQTAALKAELDQLAKQYPIQLPPYFVLILRAFGTLEGLGLSTEGDFAIVDECFPCAPPHTAMQRVANRDGKGVGWEMSSRGRFATPAGFLLLGCSSY